MYANCGLLAEIVGAPALPPGTPPLRVDPAPPDDDRIGDELDAEEREYPLSRNIPSVAVTLCPLPFLAELRGTCPIE